MANPTRRLFHSFLLLALLLGLTIPALSHPVSAAASETGVMVPLYSYPGSGWSAILQARDAHPDVPIVAVVNPQNGPGAARDSNYVTWINELKAAGVTVIGYVWTDYGTRGTASVESDISTYKSWYGVGGIFFDQMSNVPGLESYYATLDAYTHSLGLGLTVGNAGTSVPAAYVGSMDCLVVYENVGAPTTTRLATVTMGMSRSNFALFAYGVASPTDSYVSSIAGYVGYLYLTNGAMPQPYASFPPYFATLVSSLDVPLQNIPITVQAEQADGSPLTGMWSVVSQGGNVVASGYTPFTFQATQGEKYAVSTANYGNYTFNHWSNGATTPLTTVTASQATTLTAFYGGQRDLIDVQSITSSGAALTGMWTVVRQGGSIVASGYTPLDFYGSSGLQYTVTVSNFGSHSFEHWDNWGTDASRSLTLGQNTWLTAIYS